MPPAVFSSRPVNLWPGRVSGTATETFRPRSSSEAFGYSGSVSDRDGGQASRGLVAQRPGEGVRDSPGGRGSGRASAASGRPAEARTEPRPPEFDPLSPRGCTQHARGGWMARGGEARAGREGRRSWLTAPLNVNVTAEGLTWAAVAVGVALRLLAYAENRTLYRDERSLLENLVALPVFDFHTTLTEYQLAPPGFLAIERMLVRLPGNDVLGGPVAPADLRHRLDLPVPRGGPAVPGAPRRPDRGGPLRALRLADLLLDRDQAVFVRPGADAGGAPARGRPGASGAVGVAGGARGIRPIALVGAAAPVPGRPSARSASGSPIRWRSCWRGSGRTSSRRRPSVGMGGACWGCRRWAWRGRPASPPATSSRMGCSTRGGSSGTGGISPSCGCRRTRWPS